MKSLLLLASALILLTTCKKGEEDPAFTLKTRKNRLTGEWTMQKGRAGFTRDNYNNSYVFDGTTVLLYTTYVGGTPTIYTGAYRLSLTINKDETFSFKEIFSTNILEASGTWKFQKKSGDLKNKESVRFTINNVARGTLKNTNIFNQQREEFVYRLKELSNKQIQLDAGGNVELDTDGPIGFTAEYMLTQRDK